MNYNFRLIGNLLVCLPILAVVLIKDYSPAQIATHFSASGHAEQFVPRLTWLKSLLDKVFLLAIIRALFLIVLSKQVIITDADFGFTQILTGILVALTMLLFILDGLLAATISNRYLPILLVITGTVILYYWMARSSR